MASAAGPIVSPLSPAVKRSTRKRQRPSFFAEEIEAPVVSATASSRKHSTRTTRQRLQQPQQPSQRAESATKRHNSNSHHRSDISQLHDTVSGLRAQLESATIQMQELRSLVGMLADLYREEQDADEEEDIFSTPLSPLLP